MSRPGDLERALLFSFGLHLFWMVTFTVVLLPGNLRMADFPEISFLGPILSEVSFPPGTETEKLIFAPLSRQVSREFVRSEVNLEPPAGKVTAGRGRGELRKPVFLPRSRKPEFLAVVSPGELNESVSGAKVSEKDSKISALKRKVWHQPPFPDYRHWLEEDGGTFVVGLHFLISPEGRVKVVEIFRTCGYPEIDLLVRRYLKSWIFVPLDPGEKRCDEWEKTVLTFRLN